MAESELRWCTVGPNTRGGQMVARSKLGFSSSTNFQADDSATVLDTRYESTLLPLRPSSYVLGFQSDSLKTLLGSWSPATDSIATKELVTTTRLTPGANFLIAFRMDVVPVIAGSRSSVFGSDQLKWKGEAATGESESMPY